MGKLDSNNTGMTTDEGKVTPLFSVDAIENRIYTVRGVQVMLDRDLAELYGVENRVLRQAVRRNIEKFPDDFLFKLTSEEAKELILIGVSQFVTPFGYNTGGAQMFAFTEQGVAMLSTVLRSANATMVSIAIMRAFVAMRHFLISNAQVFQRLERIEYKQLESERKMDQLFDKLEEKSIQPRQNVFFDGQVYDAYGFVNNLIRRAKREIIVIDNYVNDEVLTMLDKRGNGVKATIYTKTVSKELQLDLVRHNAQYSPIDVKPFGKSHDRFLVIDDKVYHFGASLKDLGKSWFAVSLLEDIDSNTLISNM